jgi:hypothetical protein
MPRGADISQRIAGDRHDVGVLSGLQGAGLVVDAEQSAPFAMAAISA